MDRPVQIRNTVSRSQHWLSRLTMFTLYTEARISALRIRTGKSGSKETVYWNQQSLLVLIFFFWIQINESGFEGKLLIGTNRSLEAALSFLKAAHVADLDRRVWIQTLLIIINTNFWLIVFALSTLVFFLTIQVRTDKSWAEWWLLIGANSSLGAAPSIL